MPILKLINLINSKFIDIDSVSHEIYRIVDLTTDIYSKQGFFIDQKKHLSFILLLFTNLINAIIQIINSNNNNVYRYLKSVELDIIYELTTSKCKITSTYYFLNRLKNIFKFY